VDSELDTDIIDELDVEMDSETEMLDEIYANLRLIIALVATFIADGGDYSDRYSSSMIILLPT
jgi:hypothetical protein